MKFYFERSYLLCELEIWMCPFYIVFYLICNLDVTFSFASISMVKCWSCWPFFNFISKHSLNQICGVYNIAHFPLLNSWSFIQIKRNLSDSWSFPVDFSKTPSKTAKNKNKNKNKKNCEELFYLMDLLWNEKYSH